jgi:hypothetical protein
MVLYSKQYAWFPYVNSTFTSVPGPLKCKHICKRFSLKEKQTLTLNMCKISVLCKVLINILNILLECYAVLTND